MGMNYAQRLKAQNQAIFEAGQDVGFQKAMDYVICALHDPDVMGKDILGAPRLAKVIEGVVARDAKYAEAFTTKKEADVLQEHLDRELREIYHDKMVPFAKRYPIVKQIDYSKRVTK